MIVTQQLHDTAEHIAGTESWTDALAGIASGLELVERAARGMGDAVPLGRRAFYLEAEILAGEARRVLSDGVGRVHATVPLGEQPDRIDSRQVGAVHRSAATLAEVISSRFAAAIDDPMTAEELLTFGDVWLAADRLQLVLAREADDGDLR